MNLDQAKQTRLNFEMDATMPPIPEHEPLPEVDDDNDWIDEPDPNNGEEVFVHYFGEEDVKGNSRVRYQSKLTPDYATRLEKERANWKSQEEVLVQAYMEMKAEGVKLEEEGEGVDSFTCRVYGLTGE